MYGEEKLKELVGQTVTGLFVALDEEDLRVVCADGRALSMHVEGECCSHSWWNDVLGVKQLLGAKVTAVEEIDMHDDDFDDGGEYIRIYGIKISTDRGACDLIFRNESNGYYGGSADYSWVDDIPSHYVAITEDWSA